MKLNGLVLRKLNFTIVFFLCYILSTSYGIAATHGLKETHHQNDLPMQRIGLTDGLLSLEVTDVFQQSNGLIWISSAEGLSRFDGNKFTHFQHDPANEHTLSNNFINGLAEDSNGGLWVVSEHGLNRIFPNGKIKRYYHDPLNDCSIASNWLLSIFVDKDEDVWIGSGSGLSRYNEEGDCFENYPAYDPADGKDLLNSIYSIGQSIDGILYTGTHMGLFQVDKNLKQLIQPDFKSPYLTDINKDYVVTIKRNFEGELVFGTEKKGLFTLDSKNNQLTPLDEINNYLASVEPIVMNEFEYHSSGELWLATNSGLINYQLDSGKISHHKHNRYNKNSLPNDEVYRVIEDNSGGVWLSTMSGVAFYSPYSKSAQFYQNMPNRMGLVSDVIYAVKVHKNGNVWIAGDNGVNILELSSNKMVTIPSPFASDEKYSESAYAIEFDENDQVFIAYEMGLQITDQHGRQLALFSNEDGNKWNLPMGPYYNLAIDRQGGLWVGGFMGTGIFHFDYNKQVISQYLHHDEHVYTADGNYAYKLIQSRNGELWIASTGGLFRINPFTKQDYYYPIGLENQVNRVTDLIEDHDGQIWLTSSGNGLIKVHQDINHPENVRFEYMNQQIGLNELVLKSIIVDQNNQLWFTSSNLLYRFNSKNNNLSSFPSLIIDEELITSEASSTASGDNIFIGTNKGLLNINTTNLQSNSLLPPILLTEFITGEQSINTGLYTNTSKTLELNFEQNNFEIRFASLDYTRPKLNQYRYKLIGSDEHWVYQQSAKTARYSNLPPGNYTFKVQGTNSDGIWSDKQASLKIHIARPFWHYWLLVFVVLLVALILLNLSMRKQKVDALFKRANYDGLTGLKNRDYFYQSAHELIDKNKSFALAFIDMDYFKQINDTYGHSIGDLYIKAVGERLYESVRAKDIVARISGDEFAILFHLDTEHKYSEDLAQRVLSSINKGFQIEQQAIKGSASIGLAHYPEDASDLEDLFKKADTAMYAAKYNGRNTLCLYQNELSQRIEEAKRFDLAMKEGLKRNQFSVYYQPKVSVIDEEIVSFEALVRWSHPEMGNISPSRFISRAENNGFIIELGVWVLNTACQSAYQWWERGLIVAPISINVSPAQIFHEKFIENIRDAINSSGLPPHMLEIEVTETLFIDDIELAKKILNQLKAMNIRIALDDFGTGFSSLNYLTQLPISTLKIDRSFIRDAVDNSKSNLILTNIFSLANDLNLNVVAEGVENVAQLELVRANSCHLIQGFYYSAPVNYRTANELLLMQADKIVTPSEELSHLISEEG